ncbi:MAG: transcription elongation factor GreA [Chitinispirillales bacterium]|jgi:transcription elongation factor GreA|nr:transcription elongation factor GreA [Chitinispirillales bacterium]
MEKTYLTRGGYERLATDLEQLQTVRRREIAAQLELARSHGDLSENAEYDAAKHAMQLNEARIRELQEKLTTAEIINTDNVSTDKVLLGTKVTLWDFTYKEEIEYEITGSDEADPAAGRISVNSPVATALLGHPVGAQVEVKAPRGVMKYEIRKISR